jgi:CBS domain-containing protein
MMEDKYLITPDDTLENAMRKIESNKHRSLIVVHDGRVVGVISDGDIRKALLMKRLLITRVGDIMKLNFAFMTHINPREAEDLFHKLGIFLVPVVNGAMGLKDIIVRDV